MLLATGLQAQTGGIGDPASAPGVPASSYAISGIDHVNYYNGHVDVSIPVLTIAGRGTISQTAVVKIEQQWSVSGFQGTFTPSAPLQPPEAPIYAVGSLQVFPTSANP